MKRHKTVRVVVLLLASLLLPSCEQPLKREQPQWYIVETYQAALADFRVMTGSVERLDPDGKETGETVDFWLENPNFARMVTRKSGTVTGGIVSDGQKLIGWDGKRIHESPGPRRLAEIDLSNAEEIGLWGLGLLLHPELITGLTHVETTGSEQLNDREVVRLSGEDTPVGQQKVEVVVWISPDSGLPVKYQRKTGDKTLVIGFRNVQVNPDLRRPDLRASADPGLIRQEGNLNPDAPRLAPGDPVPDFELQTVEGKAFRLSGLKGRVVLLEYWAPW